MRLLPVVSVAALAVGCSAAPSVDEYTLYRAQGSERVHLATFDSRSPGEHNRENCHAIQDRLMADGRHRYWCEKGRYRD